MEIQNEANITTMTPVRVAIILLNVNSMNSPLASNITHDVPTLQLSSSSANCTPDQSLVIKSLIRIDTLGYNKTSWLAQLTEGETVNLKAVGSILTLRVWRHVHP